MAGSQLDIISMGDMGIMGGIDSMDFFGSMFFWGVALFSSPIINETLLFNFWLSKHFQVYLPTSPRSVTVPPKKDIEPFFRVGSANDELNLAINYSPITITIVMR